MTIRIRNCLFNTSPIAAHCPGPLDHRWHRFSEAVLAQPQRELKNSELTLITWNTGARPARPEKPCGVFEQSVAKLGLPVQVLGKGIRNWQNRDKFRLTAEALKQVTTEFVLGADSCDVLLLNDPQIAVNRFREEFNCDLLFNATGSRCWPELPELVEFQSSRSMAAVAQGRHWINSGLFIGRTEFCCRYFQAMADEPPVMGFAFSDQAVVMQSWPKWYPKVQADYLSQIFQWFNEELNVMRLEHPLASRQSQLIEWFRHLPGPLVGAEVGVLRGHTSEALLRELPDLKLWMIDPWKPYKGESSLGDQSPGSMERAKGYAEFWTEFARQRRFILREASPQAADRFANNSLNFVLIDGNHLYESVCADINAWWPKLRPGGMLTGHDYAINRDKNGQWGVQKAVDQFSEEVNQDLLLGKDGTWGLKK